MSTTTHIALIAALESGVSVRLENVVLFSGEHKAKSYIETLNPFGRIPTLVDGDLVLYESRAIMKHLALSYSTPGTLVPVDTAARVQMEKLVSIELSYFSPTLIKAVAPMVNVELGFAAAVDEAAVTSSLNNADVLITIDLLEATLLASAATGEPFLVGNAMTLAECAYFTWIFWRARILLPPRSARQQQLNSIKIGWR